MDAVFAERGRATRAQHCIAKETRTDGAGEVGVARCKVLNVVRSEVLGDGTMKFPRCTGNEIQSDEIIG